jgi:hypothetical protein
VRPPALREIQNALGPPPTKVVHFVIQKPGLEGQAARDERVAITRAELGF